MWTNSYLQRWRRLRVVELTLTETHVWRSCRNSEAKCRWRSGTWAWEDHDGFEAWTHWRWHQGVWGHWLERAASNNFTRNYEDKTNLMSLAVLFHFFCAQHISDINISTIRSLRLFVELPHCPYCSWFDVCWSFGVVGLEWYPCCMLKLQLTQWCTVQ